MESWEGKSSVILVDAISSNGAAEDSKPGTIYRFDAHGNMVLPPFLSCSTHNFGLTEAVEMSRVLNRLPERLIVYGVVGKNFQPGEGLSGIVENSVEKVVEQILNESSRN